MSAPTPHEHRPGQQGGVRGVLAAGRESWADLLGNAPHGSRRWWPDIGLVVGLLLWNTLATAAVGGPFWLVGVVQVVPLLWRRRSPLPAALGVAFGCLVQVMVVDQPHPANIAVLIAVYSAAVYGSRRDARLVLALGAVGSLVAGVSWSMGLGQRSLLGALFPIVFLTMVLLMVVGISWILGDIVRRRKAVVARLQQQNRALARDQAQRARLAAQDERASIAREMHDVVAHSLAVVVVQADGALYAARAALDRPPAIGADREALERAAATLDTLAGTARSSLAETRRLVGVLRTEGAGAEYSPLQGLAHLENLVARVRDSGVDVHLAVRGRTDDLPREVDLAAYRVIQESLTNVLKHAGTEVGADVDVLRTPTVLLVRVTDDGRGQTKRSDGEGNGIPGMAERVEVLGGAVRAGPRPRGGWEVVATIPVTVDGIPSTSDASAPGDEQ